MLRLAYGSRYWSTVNASRALPRYHARNYFAPAMPESRRHASAPPLDAASARAEAFQWMGAAAIVLAVGELRKNLRTRVRLSSVGDLRGRRYHYAGHLQDMYPTLLPIAYHRSSRIRYPPRLGPAMDQRL